MHDETPPPNNAVKQVLGRYELLKRIGRGGMGDVWLADDPRLHRQVAIKTLPIYNQDNHEFSQQFEREAQAAAALNHPHILPVHDFGEQALPNGRVMTYIVMPYISGGSLAEKIDSYQRNRQLMPVQEAVSYLTQAAEAIDFAHSKGIVHRDIKPGNMLLRNDGWLLLTDFGIARILSGYEQLTQRGVGFGTPEYMAPEQAQGQAEPASDNYSLAVLAYQLFTGRVPFSTESSYATTMQHLMMPPPAPRSFNPNIPLALEQALLHGLAKQPTQRPITARALLGEIQQATVNAPFEGTYMPSGALPTMPQQNYPATTPSAGTFIVPPPPPPATEKKLLSRRQIVIGGSSAAVVLVGAGGLGLWTIERGKTQMGGQVAKQTTSGRAGAAASPASTTTTTTTALSVGTPIVIQGKHNKPIATLAWSPKQNQLVSVGDTDDKNIYLWDMATLAQQSKMPKEKASLQFDNASDMLAVWSPAGDIVAIANAEPAALIGAAQIVVYKSDFSDYAPGFSSNFAMNNSASFDGLAWGNNYFYTVHHPFSLSNIDLNAKDQILVWDPKNPQKPVSAIPIDNLFMSPSDNLSKVNENTFFDIVTNPILLRTQPNGAVRITLGTHDGILMGDVTMVGRQAQWQKVGLMKFDESDQYAPADVGAISWANFGQHLAAIQQCLSQPKTVKVFDFASKTYQTLSQHENATGGISTIAWNPTAGSQILAGGNEDGKIDIWDYSRSKLPTQTITPPSSVTGIVKSLAWSADGVWLAAAYTDTNASLVIWKMGGN